jgi:hypothetical protein
MSRAASKVSLPTIKRLETIRGELAAHVRTVEAIRAALEKAGIEFLDEDGGGPGVRLLHDFSPNLRASACVCRVKGGRARGTVSP